MTMTYRNSNQKKNDSHEVLLQKAEDSMMQAIPAVVGTHRLHYHFTAQAYWMNDPNGLVYYDGYYHVFYQHHPFSPDWGPMHWGHARTKDFITWEHLPIALAPSEDYDLDGCFSGSAVVDGDLLHLFYTGHRIIDGQVRQVQCRATSSDGIHFVKDPRNPLIDSFPPDGSPDFRDPKVWKHDDVWFMAIGSGKEGRGNVLLYSSQDLGEWQYVGILAESDGTQGTVWECPDIFPLGDKHVLLVSPMGAQDRRVMYFVGEMDYETGRFTAEYRSKLDYGLDFYAAQTFSGTDRRIMLAWMDAWECPIPSKVDNWAGALTLPRELSLDDDGRLRIHPLPELEGLRQKQLLAVTAPFLTEEKSFSPVDLSEAGIEMSITLDLAATTATELGLSFSFPESSEQVRVECHKATGDLCLDTHEVHAGKQGCYTATINPQSQELRLRIFLDRSSIEVFADDGASTITARVYPRSQIMVPHLFASDGQIKVTKLACWSLAK